MSPARGAQVPPGIMFAQPDADVDKELYYELLKRALVEPALIDTLIEASAAAVVFHHYRTEPQIKRRGEEFADAMERTMLHYVQPAGNA
ncbi:MAG: hypothetical protein ACU0BF_09195 [Paracoccaceae bacterium]